MAAGADLPLLAWRPPTRVVPFPLTRRRDLIARAARRMAELRPHKAAEHLQRLLDQQAGVMSRRGIAEDVIVSEVHALDAAVRREYARYGLQVGQPGGGAA